MKHTGDMCHEQTKTTISNKLKDIMNMIWHMKEHKSELELKLRGEQNSGIRMKGKKSLFTKTKLEVCKSE